MRQSLRFDGSNQISWPVVSSEDAEWLMLALKVGLTEETITSMAMDEAHYGRDMLMMTAKTEEEPALAELVFDERYHSFHDYYCEIANYRNLLIGKFEKILKN